MNEALIVVLVLMWAVALLPSVLRSRGSNTHATVGGFERAMDVLRQRPDGRYVMVPDNAARLVGDDRHGDQTLARRRKLFARLLGMTSLSLLFAFVWGGFLWTLASLSLLGLGGYAAVLRRWKVEREQAREVVRQLPVDQEPNAYELPDRQVVGGDPIFGEAGARSSDAQPSGGGVQVATHPNDPWAPHSGVRIRRWDD